MLFTHETDWENILGILNLSDQLLMRGAHCT